MWEGCEEEGERGVWEGCEEEEGEGEREERGVWEGCEEEGEGERGKAVAMDGSELAGVHVT